LKGKAEEEEDDGSFDIDDIPLQASSAPSPSHNERQSGAPIIGTSSAAMAQEANDNDQADLDTEHHDPRHLRQYDIPMRNEGKQRSPRLRTPQNLTHPPLPRHSERTPTSRDRRVTPSVREGDKVKAFVVFGADSSDAETTASEDN